MNAAFEAYHTPADQHLRWLVLDLREQAMRYWFLEVEPQGQVTSIAQFLQLLVQRFRPYFQSYHLQQQPNALRMQRGGYLSSSDRFLEIATQQSHLLPETLINVFLSGLTVKYGTACLTHHVSDIWKAQELCSTLHFATCHYSVVHISQLYSKSSSSLIHATSLFKFSTSTLQFDIFTFSTSVVS